MYIKTCRIAAITFLIIICGSLWFLSASANAVFAATFNIDVPKKLISIQPNGPLFKMENMAPGNSQSALLTITSTANLTCLATISAERNNGDSQLADLLDISVCSLDQSIIYYAGPLSGLRQISLGSIDSMQDKEVSLQITLPTKVGNEVQGRSLSVNFVIVAIAQEPVTSQGSGDGTLTVVVSDESIPEAAVIMKEPGTESGKPAATDDGQTSEPIPAEITAVLKDDILPQGPLPGTGGVPLEAVVIIGTAFIGLGIGMKIRRKSSEA